MTHELSLSVRHILEGAARCFRRFVKNSSVVDEALPSCRTRAGKTQELIFLTSSSWINCLAIGFHALNLCTPMLTALGSGHDGMTGMLY